MKRLYYLVFVFFISYEFFVVALSLIFLYLFDAKIGSIASSLNINQDIQKYVILVPISIFIWIVKEARDLVLADKDNVKILMNWPDYWKFKCHVYVSLVYGLIFSLFSIFPWFFKGGLGSASGFVFLVISLIGSFLAAGSVYFAQISLKEIFSME